MQNILHSEACEGIKCRAKSFIQAMPVIHAGLLHGYIGLIHWRTCMYRTEQNECI